MTDGLRRLGRGFSGSRAAELQAAVEKGLLGF